MTTPTRRVSPDEMQTRIARFKDLVSTKARHAESKGIPAEVFEIMTAKTTFNVMSPGNLGGQLGWASSPARQATGRRCTSTGRRTKPSSRSTAGGKSSGATRARTRSLSIRTTLSRSRRWWRGASSTCRTRRPA
jgi:hypothetical protein